LTEGETLALAKLRKLWENEYFKTAIMIISVVAIVFGFWYGSQLVLNTEYPALAVASGSMCEVQGMRCKGWDHPFAPTLHVGDLIIVHGIDRKQIVVGDVIVFHKPLAVPTSSDELIVHRVIELETNPNNNLTYFETSGDASGNMSDPFDTDYRGEDYVWNNKISEKLVVGKVVLRVPWVGHISLFMRNSSGLLIIVVLIIAILIVEFIIPTFTREETETKPKEDVEKASET